MKTLISPISTLEADFETYHEDKHTILICIEISLMKLVIDGQHLKIFKNSPAAVWFFDIMFLCSNFACFSSIILVYYMLSFIVGLNFKFLKYVEISWENNIMDMKKSSRQEHYRWARNFDSIQNLDVANGFLKQAYTDFDRYVLSTKYQRNNADIGTNLSKVDIILQVYHFMTIKEIYVNLLMLMCMIHISLFVLVNILSLCNFMF